MNPLVVITNWTTNGGGFVTKSEVPLTFKLPGFTPSKSITYTFQIDETKSNHEYDVNLGRDIQRALGMDILLSKETLLWKKDNNLGQYNCYHAV